MLSGLLNINKPADFSSHDVVAWVRRMLGIRRVGHAGTLDPMATGVLVVCVGPATRLLEYQADEDKEYLAECTFGVSTDSLDRTGVVLKEMDGSFLTRDDLLQIIPRFIGEIDQIPPMVSAIQIGGERLYNKALRGESVERKPRRIQIKELELTEFQDGVHPIAKLRIVCSKGTYIRSLCDDIGNALGTGGMLSSLVRSRVGNFSLEESITLTDLEREGESLLLPMTNAVKHLKPLFVSDLEARSLIAGGFVSIQGDFSTDDVVRIMSDEKTLVGMGRIYMEEGALRVHPEKIVVPRNIE